MAESSSLEKVKRHKRNPAIVSPIQEFDNLEDEYLYDGVVNQNNSPYVAALSQENERYAFKNDSSLNYVHGDANETVVSFDSNHTTNIHNLRDDYKTNQDTNDTMLLPLTSCKNKINEHAINWHKSRAQRGRLLATINPIDSNVNEPLGLVSGNFSASNTNSALQKVLIVDNSSSTCSSSGVELTPRDFINAEEPAYVISQKKDWYSAKVRIPGQNPIYLGRFNTSCGARRACENALANFDLK